MRKWLGAVVVGLLAWTVSSTHVLSQLPGPANSGCKAGEFWDATSQRCKTRQSSGPSEQKKQPEYKFPRPHDLKDQVQRQIDNYKRPEAPEAFKLLDKLESPKNEEERRIVGTAKSIIRDFDDIVTKLDKGHSELKAFLAKSAALETLAEELLAGLARCEGDEFRLTKVEIQYNDTSKLPLTATRSEQLGDLKKRIAAYQRDVQRCFFSVEENRKALAAALEGHRDTMEMVKYKVGALKDEEQRIPSLLIQFNSLVNSYRIHLLSRQQTISGSDKGGGPIGGSKDSIEMPDEQKDGKRERRQLQ